MIIFNEKEKVWHLQTEKTSYIIHVTQTGHVGNLYYGHKIDEKASYASMDQGYTYPAGSSTVYSETVQVSLNTMALEYSSYGKGDYREPPVHIEYGEGIRTTDFTYVGYEVQSGKTTPEGMPGTYGDESDITTLIIELEDRSASLSMKLIYSVLYETDIIARRVELKNHRGDDVDIHRIMSFSYDTRYSDYELITLEGQWIRECHIDRRPLMKGRTIVDSKKGVSSADHNPFLCLLDHDTTESMGSAYGFALVYSGSHECSVEVSPQSFTRVQMGIQSFDFRWRLAPGEVFTTPEAVMTYSRNGLNGMSQNFHDMVNRHLIPKQWQNRPRPILANNWEATYFDFDDRKILKLAQGAKDLGIELFVLDDGWFTNRNNDESGLGDWKVDYKKLRKGIKGLATKVRAMGLKFGLWVEPEMINTGTEVQKKHPEWMIKCPDRAPSPGRNQFLLDLGRSDVQDYLHRRLSKIFSESDVDYVKWDMNRNFSDVYSKNLTKEHQMEFAHRYTLGLYKLMNRLVTDFPDVLFESCSSGGNRFDLGMLYYMPQTWTSDNTDAGARMKIQYGTSLVYPPSTMGAHVSGKPSHQMLRRTPIETRFNVAAFGQLGYELDLTKLTVFEKKVIKEQVDFYKKYRSAFQYGKFTRIRSPFESDGMNWMVTSEDKSIALMGDYQLIQEPSPGLEYISVPEIDENVVYTVFNRKQYMNIRQFGELVNEYLPVKIKDGSISHNLISDRYMFECEQWSHVMKGDELKYVGIRPYSQFIGTGYDESTRLMGDFGSRLYVMEKKAVIGI